MNQFLAPGLSSPLFERLEALRAAIKTAGLDGFLVPMADEYQNEHVPASAQRVAYLTAFTGSAAFVIVMLDRAVFFTDSRYTLQAAVQVPSTLYTLLDVAKTTPTEWLEENATAQMKIGFDPTLHTAKQIERMEVVLLKHNASLSPTDQNLVDTIWTDRPAAPCAPIVTHEIAYAGKGSAAKRGELAEKLEEKGLAAAIITDPSSIAWLLNIRGGDVPLVPLPLSRAILRADATVEWFVDSRKCSPELDMYLGENIVRNEETAFAAALKQLGETQSPVLVDPDEASYSVVSLLREAGAVIERGEDPCVMPRACKNQTELEGMRSAHRRDGAALVKLMAWFDQEAPSGKLTELEVEEKLGAFRAESELSRGPSFDTIAGAGANGAIVHYRATPETNAKIRPGSFLLLDSGGHYLDGTTDVTRTLPVGEVSQEMKERYTLVLKGLIALASVRFPEGTAGADIDVLARQYLWAEGLDYGHGTGHGVGSYLCVHEGPQAISRRSDTPLRPGMVLSNEPGYYKARHYGIRLENLQFVIEQFDLSNAERKILGFETLTLAPFDRRAILKEQLTVAERDWLDAYHIRVCKALRPQLDEATISWLKEATATL